MNWRTQRPVGFALERPAAFLKVPIAIRPAISPTTAEVPCRIWQSYTSSAQVSEGGSRVRQETRIARRKRAHPEGEPSAVFDDLEADESVHEEAPVDSAGQAEMNRSKPLQRGSRSIGSDRGEEPREARERTG